MQPNNLQSKEILTRFLSNFLHISEVSSNADVNNIRNNKFNEKVEKLKASAAEEYIRNVSDDPDNIKAHIAVHEHNIENIEKLSIEPILLVLIINLVDMMLFNNKD